MEWVSGSGISATSSTRELKDIRDTIQHHERAKRKQNRRLPLRQDQVPAPGQSIKANPQHRLPLPQLPTYNRVGVACGIDRTERGVKGFSITQGEDTLKSHADTKTDSGQPLTRKLCSECGSRLFAFTPLNESIVMIAAGTLDDFEDWKPSKEQYCIHRLGFVDKMLGVEGQNRHVTNMRSEAEQV
ncbi:hypothetical protein LTR75_010487 [Friedmanniomyces endolithicus]|nr:hypothetical protein LTR75_010487 [Friedmanniomyces endolithicus]